MTIFDRIAETRESFAQMDVYEQESMATGCLLKDISEWGNLLKFRSLGWNYNLINDTDHRDLHTLIQATPEEFNKQQIPIRLTVVGLLLDVQAELNAKGIY